MRKWQFISRFLGYPTFKQPPLLSEKMATWVITLTKQSCKTSNSSSSLHSGMVRRKSRQETAPLASAQFSQNFEGVVSSAIPAVAPFVFPPWTPAGRLVKGNDVDWCENWVEGSLVGGWPTPLKNMKVLWKSMGRMKSHILWKIIQMFETTNQFMLANESYSCREFCSCLVLAKTGPHTNVKDRRFSVDFPVFQNDSQWKLVTSRVTS